MKPLPWATCAVIVGLFIDLFPRSRVDDPARAIARVAARSTSAAHPRRQHWLEWAIGAALHTIETATARIIPRGIIFFQIRRSISRPQDGPGASYRLSEKRVSGTSA